MYSYFKHSKCDIPFPQILRIYQWIAGKSMFSIGKNGILNTLQRLQVLLMDLRETVFRTNVKCAFVPFSQVKCFSFSQFSHALKSTFLYFSAWRETKKHESYAEWVRPDINIPLPIVSILQKFWARLFTLTIWWQHAKWKKHQARAYIKQLFHNELKGTKFI